MQFVIIKANILNIQLKARGLSSIWLVSPAELQALEKNAGNFTYKLRGCRERGREYEHREQ